MSARILAFLALACVAIGAAAGVVAVDDHPNAQKMTIAMLRAQLQEDQRAMEPMVGPCTKFVDLVNATHVTEELPK